MLKKFSILVFIGCLFLVGCSRQLVTINSIDDLSGRKVGVFTGSEYDLIAEENISSVKVAYYNSYSDQISALKSGKIDAFLTDEPLAKEILRNNEGLRVLDNMLTEDSYAFAINPKKADLKNEIDKVINEMKEDKILEQFESKWFSSNEDSKVLEEYTQTSENGVIRFATVSGSAPFAYMKNNQIVGYDIDVINYIGYKLGYKIEIVEMAFEGMIAAISSGKVDVAGCSIIVTEERKKSVLFSEPNYTGGIVLVVRD